MKEEPGDLDLVPKHTETVGNQLVNEFTKRLSRRSVEIARRRRSATLTDADMRQAYDELLAPSLKATSKRLIGDGLMMIGAFITGAWSFHWAFVPVGLLMSFAGLYVRES